MVIKKVNCSLKTVQRLVKAYKENGKEVFVHKNRGVPSKSKTPDIIKNLVIELFKKHNKGSMVLSVKHLKDILFKKRKLKNLKDLKYILQDLELIQMDASSYE